MPEPSERRKTPHTVDPEEAGARRGRRRAVTLWPLLAELEGIDCALSLRHGGVSRGGYASLNLGRSTGDAAAAVTENRRRFARAAGIDLGATARMRQVHGNRVRCARAPGMAGEADGLVTAAAGLWLLVTVADCVPVFLVEPAAGIIGCLHAGWRGLAAGVLEAGVRRIAELGGNPARLEVALGPSIGPCCFEVGPEVAARFAPSERRRGAGGRPHVDLAAAARRRLVAAGVAAARIRPPGACTRCRSDLFFSARSGEPTGRMVGIIVRTSAGGGRRRR